MKNIVLNLLVVILLVVMLFTGTAAKVDNDFRTTTTISEVYIPSGQQPKEKEKIEIIDSILYIEPFEINYKTIDWKEYQEIQRKREKKKAVVRKQIPSNTAQIIWDTFKSWGWNDAVSAGVLGNIMAEVGGHSLSINPYLSGEGGNYYGICQWSLYYFPSVYNADLYEQLNHLKNTISAQLSRYGYDNFLAIGNAAEAARVFARYYERCASWSYSSRERNAQIAYASFVG